MISAGKSYTIFKPKETTVKGEKAVRFSIGNSSFNKETQNWENKGFINVTAITNQFISDRDRVTISEIVSIDTNEYNGKQTVSILVKLEGEKQGNYEAVPSDELPF